MVDAISVILPFSMCSSSVCCCFLLKDWISSRYRSTPLGASMVSSWETISLMSEVEAVVALSLQSLRFVRSAMMLATVVLPVPEGP